ncbi:MAG: hypothetical protein D6679_00760 [Candidatus Hydrogenedentota bacterium]|nr:MAG: hypothetical protein D6679_00760 [Candidatus Hydrogenedentota bacterium]
MEEVSRRALAWAAARDYCGFSKYDALESPVLRRLASDLPFLRWGITEAVMRSPVNLRALLGVRKGRNPKGLALFAMAYLARWKRRKYQEDLEEAGRLVSELFSIRHTSFSGWGWGYHHPWQDLGFYQPAGFPNRVVTYYVGRAAWEYYLETRDWTAREMAENAVEFLLFAPKPLFESEGELCLSYIPSEKIRMRIMDISSYAADLAAVIGSVLKRPEWLARARRLANYVFRRQTPEGGWYYTDPPSAHPKGIDNYHTAVILESLQRVQERLLIPEWENALERGWRFYAEKLFEPDGAPRWTVRKRYPYDVHSAASAVIGFVCASRGNPSYRLQARKILEWMIGNLWSEKEGCFHYQKTWWGTKRFCLMRWCQAWACRALEEFLLNEQAEGTKHVF